MGLKTVVGGLGRLAGKMGAPVISQGLTAATSLGLQIIAVRALGLAEYGAFAIFLAVLVTVTGLYTGYIGDSLVILDRHDRTLRSALVTSAGIGLAIAFVVGIITTLALRGADLGLALVYAAMLVGWLLEETFRRLLSARQEFWRLVVNDLAYLVGTAVALLSWYLATGVVTLFALFAAMGVGTLTAVVVGCVQLPADELSNLRPGGQGLREVAAFAGWRSLHATLRPAALLGLRVLVANLVSLTAVGILEAARLVVAPLQVIINGAGNFLMAGFAAMERKGGRRQHALTQRAVILLVGVTVLGGLVLALLANPLGRLLTGGPVNPVLLLGWVAYLGVWAAGLPYITEVVARKMSRSVFWVRLADSVLGLAAVLLALVLGGSITLAPWLMALGGLYAVLRARALAIGSRKQPGPRAPGAASGGDVGNG